MRHLPFLLLPLLLASTGCFFLPFDEDRPQQHGSPCQQVNIMDGLDEHDTTEIQALYDCLNQTGAFEPLRPSVDELVSGADRHGEPLGYHAAYVFNNAARFIPVAETLSAVRQLLREENAFLIDALRLAAEWTYGMPWPQVEELAASGGLQDPDLLADGPLGHLVPVLRVWAWAILEEDDIEDAGEVLDHLLSMPELLDTLITLRELFVDYQAGHNDLFDQFPENWGTFFIQTHQPSGENTLIEVLDPLVSPGGAADDPLVIEQMLPYVDPMLEDPVVVSRLVEGIGDLYDDGTLDELPDQLSGLMLVDMHGGTLDPGEESAFSAALTLLDEADAPFDCFELIYTDSVSVWILQEIVILGLEADTVAELVSFVEDMYGWLIEVVDLVCELPPVLKTHFDAIIQLAESGALHSLIPLLYAIADPDVPAHNYLRELVDIVHLLVAFDLVAPVEDLLVPTFEQDFMPQVLAIVGAFVDPSVPLAAGDIYTLLDVAEYLITPPPEAAPGDYHKAPLITAARIVDDIVSDPATYQELDLFLLRWGELLVAEDAVTHEILYGIEGLLDLDPELKTLDLLGDIFDDYDVCYHWVMLFENEGFMGELGQAGSPGGEEVPMAMLGRLIADGTTEDLLLLVGWVVDVFDTLGIEL